VDPLNQLLRIEPTALALSQKIIKFVFLENIHEQSPDQEKEDKRDVVKSNQTFSCSANPISNNRSASSKTRYWTPFNLNVEISWR
jgi:hypothetical protein